MCCSVAKVIIILQIIPILLWDFEGGIGSSFFIYFVHDVITRILSPFKAFIPVYFLYLFMSCNSFIHRDNLALLIQRYFTPKILESGNAQLSFEFCYLSDDLMIFFFPCWEYIGAFLFKCFHLCPAEQATFKFS